MANVAQLIRRQSSRELLRVPLDRLELRELQHRLLPGEASGTGNAAGGYGAAVNAGFVDESGNSSTAQQQQQQVELSNSICFVTVPASLDLSRRRAIYKKSIRE